MDTEAGTVDVPEQIGITFRGIRQSMRHRLKRIAGTDRLHLIEERLCERNDFIIHFRGIVGCITAVPDFTGRTADVDTAARSDIFGQFQLTETAGTIGRTFHGIGIHGIVPDAHFRDCQIVVTGGFGITVDHGYGSIPAKRENDGTQSGFPVKESPFFGAGVGKSSGNTETHEKTPPLIFGLIEFTEHFTMILA